MQDRENLSSLAGIRGDTNPHLEVNWIIPELGSFRDCLGAGGGVEHKPKRGGRLIMNNVECLSAVITVLCISQKCHSSYHVATC